MNSDSILFIDGVDKTTPRLLRDTPSTRSCSITGPILLLLVSYAYQVILMALIEKTDTRHSIHKMHHFWRSQDRRTHISRPVPPTQTSRRSSSGLFLPLASYCLVPPASSSQLSLLLFPSSRFSLFSYRGSHSVIVRCLERGGVDHGGWKGRCSWVEGTGELRNTYKAIILLTAQTLRRRHTWSRPSASLGQSTAEAQAASVESSSKRYVTLSKALRSCFSLCHDRKLW